MNEHTKRVRDAMKWWRAANPDKAKHVRVVRHPYAGHVLWTTAWSAGVLMSVSELLALHEREAR
jgi:hypothetical protein